MSRSRSTSSYLAPGELYVFADSACRSIRDTHLAGYGLYAPLHSIRIAEPLPGSAQTIEKAQLHALHAALELVHGLRARIAIVYMHSSHVVDGYEKYLRSWQANRWHDENGCAIRNHRLWRDVWDLYNIFLDRGVDVTVKLREHNSDHNMRTANRLARFGTTMHVTCELCRKTHGRQWGSHDCEPICDLDHCSGRVLKNVHSYMKHMRRRHQKKCRRKDCALGFNTFIQEELDEHERDEHGGLVFDCEFCGEYFKSPRRVKRHIRNSCKHVPYCSSCGRLFKSKTDLRKRNWRASDSDSNTESDDFVAAGFGGSDGLVDEENGIGVAGQGFGTREFASRSRQNNGVKGHFLNNEGDQIYGRINSDGSSDVYSLSSSNELESHRTRRQIRGDHSEGSKHGHRHRRRSGRHKHRRGRRHTVTGRERRHGNVDTFGTHLKYANPDAEQSYTTHWYRAHGGSISE